MDLECLQAALGVIILFFYLLAMSDTYRSIFYLNTLSECPISSGSKFMMERSTEKGAAISLASYFFLSIFFIQG